MARTKAAEESETTLTEIAQVKLAVSIPGTTTQTLMAKDFSLLYDSSKMVLYVHKKNKPEDKYVIHASNIAYLKL